MRRSCSPAGRVITVFSLTLLAILSFFVVLSPGNKPHLLHKRADVVVREPQSLPAFDGAPTLVNPIPGVNGAGAPTGDGNNVDRRPTPTPDRGDPSPSSDPPRNSRPNNSQPDPSPSSGPSQNPSPDPSPSRSPDPSPSQNPSQKAAPSPSSSPDPVVQQSSTPPAPQTTPVTTAAAATTPGQTTQPLTTTAAAVSSVSSALPTVTAKPATTLSGPASKNAPTVTIPASSAKASSSETGTPASVSTSEKFWQNKSAVAGTFTTVALIIIGGLAAAGVLIHRHLQAKREDEEFFEKSWDPPDVVDHGGHGATGIEDVEFLNITQPAPTNSYPDRRIHLGELGKIRGHRATPSKQHAIDNDGEFHEDTQPLADVGADRRVHLGKIRGHRATPSKQHVVEDEYTPREYGYGGGYSDTAEPRDPHTYGWNQPGSDPFAGSSPSTAGFHDAERETGYPDAHDSFYMAR